MRRVSVLDIPIWPQLREITMVNTMSRDVPDDGFFNLNVFSFSTFLNFSIILNIQLILTKLLGLEYEIHFSRIKLIFNYMELYHLFQTTTSTFSPPQMLQRKKSMEK